jgi:hypothetical protein
MTRCNVCVDGTCAMCRSTAVMGTAERRLRTCHYCGEFGGTITVCGRISHVRCHESALRELQELLDSQLARERYEMMYNPKWIDTTNAE